METITPGRTIRVGPEQVSLADVFEHTMALLEQEGWNQTPAQTESSVEHGWTLHDALGESVSRLFGTHSGHKDATTRIGGRDRSLRNEAMESIRKITGMDDKVFNDKAKDLGEVLDVLRRAREQVLA